MHLHAAILLAASTMVTVRASAEFENLGQLLSNRRIRRNPCEPDEYPHEGRCCLQCPAGTRVSKHCTQDREQSQCLPCTPGRNFTASPNGMESCVSCHPCRSDDQVQVSVCTATADYTCQCKPNTFCTEGCNIVCTKCSSCPKGYQLRYPCTPTTDTMCVDSHVTDHPTREQPGTTQMTDSDSLEPGIESSICRESQGCGPWMCYALFILLPLLLLSIIIIFILGFIVWKKRPREKPGPALDAELQAHLIKVSNENNSEVSTPEAPRISSPPDQPAREQLVNVTATDESPIQMSQTQQACTCNCRAGSAPPSCAGVTRNENEAGVANTDESDDGDNGVGGRARGLQLTDQEWLLCYICLKEHVLPSRWKELMRFLGLSESDINITHIDHSGVQEVNYQMLLLWRYQNGHRATMSKVLSVLDQMHLGGCRERIVSSLTEKGIYVS